MVGSGYGGNTCGREQSVGYSHVVWSHGMDYGVVIVGSSHGREQS